MHVTKRNLISRCVTVEHGLRTAVFGTSKKFFPFSNDSWVGLGWGWVWWQEVWKGAADALCGVWAVGGQSPCSLLPARVGAAVSPWMSACWLRTPPPLTPRDHPPTAPTGYLPRYRTPPRSALLASSLPGARAMLSESSVPWSQNHSPDRLALFSRLLLEVYFLARTGTQHLMSGIISILV